MEFSLSFHDLWSAESYVLFSVMCSAARIPNVWQTNLVLEFVQGRALQMLRLLSSNAVACRAINFVSAHAAPTARRSGVATAGGRGGKPWTFGFGSPATRTGSTRHVRAGPVHQRNSRAHSPRPRLTFPPSSFRRRRQGPNPSRSLIFSAPISPAITGAATLGAGSGAMR